MKVQMTSATANALARATGGCLDNVKAEGETLAGPRTEPQIRWPRNGVGEYTTIAELMSEATENRPPALRPWPRDSGLYLDQARGNRRAAIPHSLRAKPGFRG